MRYRWQRVFSLTPWSAQIRTEFLVLRATWDPTGRPLRFRVRGYHPLWRAVPGTSANGRFCHSLRDGAISLVVPLPRQGNAARLDTLSVWAVPRSLAATKGIASAFFSSGYLDVSVPRVPSTPPMDSAVGDRPLRRPGYPIRRSSDQSLFAAPRGVSPLTASFIGPLPQGIHRAPFVA